MDLSRIDALIGETLDSAAWVDWWRGEEPVWVRRHRGLPVLKSDKCFVRGPVVGNLHDDRLRSLTVDLAALDGAALGVARGDPPSSVRAHRGPPAASEEEARPLFGGPYDLWELGNRMRLRVEYDQRGAVQLSVWQDQVPVAVSKKPAKKNAKAARARRARTAAPPRVVRAQSLMPAFLDRLARLGVDRATLTPRQGVEHMVSYYDEVEIEGRARGMADQLLYEHSVRRRVLTCHVLRQIYAAGRGVQLDLVWTARTSGVVPSFSRWSGDEVPAWREAVAHALDELERSAPDARFTVELRIERF